VSGGVFYFEPPCIKNVRSRLSS